ncbi:MAG: NnrU family protein, partial [Pseudomonadota bacterium]|nr:NnrU family protein [Pseudomonadota bacterium]
LLANGTLADLLLFGSFLAWAIVDFAANRRRDRRDGTVRIAGPARNDAIAVGLGVVLWAAFVWRLHEWLIGVSPLA